MLNLICKCAGGRGRAGGQGKASHAQREGGRGQEGGSGKGYFVLKSLANNNIIVGLSTDDPLPNLTLTSQLPGDPLPTSK